MRKTIATVALALLFAVSAFSLLSMLIPVEHDKAPLAYSLTFPGELEDQQDDSDPSRDNETDQDNDFMMEKFAIVQLSISMRPTGSGQEGFVREHHREIVTPPPRI